MSLSRRQMFRTAAAGAGIVATGNVAALLNSPTALANGRGGGNGGGWGHGHGHGGPAEYGPLVADPAGILDLPERFAYSIVSDASVDGLPGRFDGTGAFAGPHRSVYLVRNHEQSTSGVSTVDYAANPDITYDPGVRGGTTTVALDRRGNKLDEYVSLAGTDNNCAGGETPWGTWLTCEETESRAGSGGRTKDHGFVFEVDPLHFDNNLAPTPLTALGRFAHEAAVLDPRTLDVYMTEDAGGPFGLVYKAVLDQPRARYGGLRGPGTLYAMAASDNGVHVPLLHPYTEPGTRLRVDWVAVPDPLATSVSVRAQFGTADVTGTVTRSQKLEGMWWADGKAYIVCSFARANPAHTPEAHAGQVWSLDPKRRTLTLEVRFAAGQGGDTPDDVVPDEPDNITVSPWGGLLLCEDSDGAQNLLYVNGDGSTSLFAKNHLNESEFAGACFSPDGNTLYANVQEPGLTFAITGPWEGRRRGR